VVEEPATNSLDDLHMPSRTHKASITGRCVASLISAASIAAILTVTPIQAAEWRIEPLIRAAGDFDDNAILTPRTDVDADISGYMIDVSAKFAYASELTTFFVTPQLTWRDYGDPFFDSNDQFLAFYFDRDTQSSNFRVRGKYDRQSVRTAERTDADLDIEDPDEIPDDDTGRVASSATRETLRLNPDWTYRMSDASSLFAGLNFTDTSYDDEIGRVYTDYANVRANLSYRRAWSPRNTAILTGTYRKYMPDIGDDGTGMGFNAGFERTLTETTRFRAIVGLEETDQGVSESDVNWVADVSLRRRLQTITLLAQYRRTVAGGGSGSLNARDSINLNFTRQLNERISAGLGVRAYQTTALNDANVNFDGRDYLQLLAQFTWNMTQTWSLEANYRYTFSDREVLGESANSNNVTIWLNYRPTPIVRSR
jgi:hypothetical protein